MATALHRLLPLASALAACAAPATEPAPAPAAACEAPYQLRLSSNPLDLALAPRFAAACLELHPAEPRELCRRLYGDLLGRYPTEAEVNGRCATWPLDQLLRELQADPRYLLQAERQWRDRFQLPEDGLDWRYRRSLYTLVDALQRGTVRYADFVARISSEPAWALLAEPAAHAFITFLGRPPSAFEAEDWSRLFALWRTGYRQGGDDNLDLLELGAQLEPFDCLALGGCKTSLFGGGEVALALPADRLGPVPFEALDAEALEALRAPGRLLAGDPLIWEAAADQLLDRFLGWDDGGFVPRTPGALLPEVREALAAQLRTTGDYPGAERLVLGSWLYRQRFEERPQEARPVYALGPLKRAGTELLLDSALGQSSPLGTCEPRYPLRYYTTELEGLLARGTYDAARTERAFARLESLLAPRTPFIQGAHGFRQPDLRYQALADVLGGCTTRSGAGGIYFALAHETVVEALCRPGLAVAGGTLEEVTRRFLARAPEAEERAAVDAALGATPDPTDLCVAVLGSGEMLYY